MKLCAGLPLRNSMPNEAALARPALQWLQMNFQLIDYIPINTKKLEFGKVGDATQGTPQ